MGIRLAILLGMFSVVKMCFPMDPLFNVRRVGSRTDTQKWGVNVQVLAWETQSDSGPLQGDSALEAHSTEKNHRCVNDLHKFYRRLYSNQPMSNKHLTRIAKHSIFLEAALCLMENQFPEKKDGYVKRFAQQCVEEENIAALSILIEKGSLSLDAPLGGAQPETVAECARRCRKSKIEAWLLARSGHHEPSEIMQFSSLVTRASSHADRVASLDNFSFLGGPAS